MKLTKFRLFMVERYLEINPKVSVTYYCNNICNTPIKEAEFNKWLDLYNQQIDSPLTKIDTKISTQHQINLKDKKTNPSHKINTNNTWVLNKELKILKNELRNTKQLLDISRYATNCHQSEIRQLNDILNEKEDALLNSINEIKDLKTKTSLEEYIELNNKLSRSSTIIIRLENQLSKHRESIINLKDQLSTSVASSKSLKRELSESKDYTIRVEKQLSKHKESIISLKDQLSISKTIIKSLKEQLSDPEAIILKLKKQVLKDEETIINLKNHLSTSRISIRNLKRELSESKAFVLRIQKKLNKSEDKISKLEFEKIQKNEIIEDIFKDFTESDICKNIINEGISIISKYQSSHLHKRYSSNKNRKEKKSAIKDVQIFLESFSECISIEAIKYCKSTKRKSRNNKITFSFDENAFVIDPENYSVQLVEERTKVIN